VGLRQLSSTDPEARLNAAISNFRALQNFHAAALASKGTSEVIDAFDRAFQQEAGLYAVAVACLRAPRNEPLGRDLVTRADEVVVNRVTLTVT
jgi:hypothetical protein